MAKVTKILLHAGRTMNNRGFTLIELLVTMAVAIILATVAAPNFVDMINRQRFATEFNSVLIGLNLARSTAIKRREAVSYVVTEAGDPDAGIGWQWQVQDGGGTVIRQASGSGNISLDLDWLDSGETPPTSITFNSLGRIDGGGCAPPCHISLEGEGRQRYYGIRISRYGATGRLDTPPTSP